MKENYPILLVEDDKVDVMTVKRALKQIEVNNDLVVKENGLEALEYLSEGSKPCLILLDINMPKMNGIEFLRRINSEEEYKKIPVVMLTTSTEEQDRIESFNLRCSGYMVKPVDYKQFTNMMNAIKVYWSLSQIPY